jgi:large subunit ribosomal protein L31e
MENQEVKKTKLEETINKAKEVVKAKENKTDVKEEKPELEREYIIPIRRRILKVPRYKRAKRAIKTIREFLAKHMKVEERDVRKIKIDKWLNEEVWFRGIKKPLTKVKVKAKKIKGIVYVELAEIPKVVQYKINKEKKFKERLALIGAKKPKVVKQKEEEKPLEGKAEEKEKEKSAAEAGAKENKVEAKTKKHETSEKHAKKTTPRRQALKK